MGWNIDANQQSDGYCSDTCNRGIRRWKIPLVKPRCLFCSDSSLLVVASSILLNWAMKVNPHFEPTVRIQDNHKVIARGPYGIVRHPGYLAGILFALSIPLLIGSAFTFIPAGIYCLLMTIRTWVEDKTLQKELKGYPEYTKQTKYRLLPKIW